MKRKITAIILTVVLVLALALPMAAVGASPGPGIVGLWHFDEGSGASTVADSSGNGNTGTVTGATTGVAGMFDNGLSFDGTNDYVDFGSDASLQLTDEFTIELWVNRTDKTTFERFLSHSTDASTYAYEVGVDYANPDEWRLRLNSDAATLTVAMAGDAGEWIHVAFVYDKSLASDNMKIYENGVEVASGDYSTSLTGHGTLLTNRAGKTDGWLKSTIDEVRIWDEALTAEQIEVSYELGTGIQIAKELSETEADLGDHITVTLDVLVADGTPVDVDVVDDLPSELHYILDTFEVDGEVATPVLDDNTVSYTFTQLGIYTITFDAQVTSAEAEDNLVTNTATADGAQAEAELTIHPYEGFIKWVVDCSEPDPYYVPMYTDVQWWVSIDVENIPGDAIITMEDVVVKDRLGGDLELDDFQASPGSSLNARLTGKTEKQHLTWDLGGDLADGASGYLWLIISTDINTGRGTANKPNGNGNNPKSGHQEYTEDGEHELNSGAVLKFIDPITGFQLSAHTPPITVVAYEPEPEPEP